MYISFVHFFFIYSLRSCFKPFQDEIDRYITWPGQALAYKMGQLRFSQLRAESEEKLGSLFDIKDFHEVVLNSYGSMDMVEEDVNLWIEKVLKGKKNLA